MSKFVLEINIKNTEGVLERILGKLRQRNANILSINAGCTEDYSSIEANLLVETNCSIEAISKQLSKLYDVQNIKVCPMQAEISHQKNFYVLPENNSLSNALGGQNAVSLTV